MHALYTKLDRKVPEGYQNILKKIQSLFNNNIGLSHTLVDFFLKPPIIQCDTKFVS